MRCCGITPAKRILNLDSWQCLQFLKCLCRKDFFFITCSPHILFRSRPMIGESPFLSLSTWRAIPPILDPLALGVQKNRSAAVRNILGMGRQWRTESVLNFAFVKKAMDSLHITLETLSPTAMERLAESLLERGNQEWGAGLKESKAAGGGAGRGCHWGVIGAQEKGAQVTTCKGDHQVANCFHRQEYVHRTKYALKIKVECGMH